jgi:hypothetical protein
MNKASRVEVCGALACAALVFSVCILPVAGEQQNSREEVKVTASDVTAVKDAGLGLVHGLAAPTPGAKEKLEAIHRERSKYAAAFRGAASRTEAGSQATSQALTGPFFYPGDLASGGGPTLATTRLHAIYVNATGSIASTWGNPEGFLRDLNESTFIHLSDQYVGTSENDRYPVGGRARVRYGTPGATVYESDIAAIVHAVALERGAGGDHVYHVFLPPGTDTCFDITAQNPTPVCYSPDNPATFDFCGYHGAASFTDIGIVLFTVEPWLGPGSGCEIATPAPNGVLADSTNNILSHETFETITDPLPGLGYSNQTGGLLSGQEIGDECVLFNFTSSPGDYSPPTFLIHGKKYAVQTEYSNTYHACATVP